MSDLSSIFNVGRLGAPDLVVRREPFPFIIAKHVLSDVHRKDLRDGFPKFKEAGFFPYVESECGPAITQLVHEAVSPEIADQLGNLLGIERLSQYPTLVSVSGHLNRRHGAIHTDSKSKIATALIYLNESWPPDTNGGCLRFLNTTEDIDSILAPELKPLYGNFAMFKRCDNSFHGHLPYEGERRVIQIAWLTSEADKQRKTKRGRVSRFVKSILGWSPFEFQQSFVEVASLLA